MLRGQKFSISSEKNKAAYTEPKSLNPTQYFQVGIPPTRLSPLLTTKSVHLFTANLGSNLAINKHTRN